MEAVSPNNEKFGTVRYLEDKAGFHDLEMSYRGLNLPGISHYILRQLLLPLRTAYFPSYLDQSQITELWKLYKKTFGIGPKQIKFVDCGNDRNSFFKKAIIQEIKRADSKKEKPEISIFTQNELTEEVFLEIAEELYGDSITQTEIDDFKAHLGITNFASSQIANSKIITRRFLTQQGMDDWNPTCFVETGKRSLDIEKFEKLKKVVAERKGISPDEVEIIVKADTDSASGDGVKKVKTYDEGVAFADEWRERKGKYEVNFLFEEVVELSEGSAQFIITKDEDGKVVVDFRRLTKQIVNEKGEHQGNMVSANPDSPINKQISVRDINRLKKLFKYYAETYGYIGYGGADLNKTADGRRILFEINARTTGAMYPLAVLEQLLQNGASENTVVLTCSTLKPPQKLQNLKDLLEYLGDEVYNKENGEGYIPTLTTLLAGDEKGDRKFGVVIVAQSEKRAEELYQKLLKRLEKDSKNDK